MDPSQYQLVSLLPETEKDFFMMGSDITVMWIRIRWDPHSLGSRGIKCKEKQSLTNIFFFI